MEGGRGPRFALRNLGEGRETWKGFNCLPLFLAPPLQAVAIVCGFLLVILLCVICFFAHKTRQKIWRFGKQNIYWDRPLAQEEGPNVEEWVRGAGAKPPTRPWCGVAALGPLVALAVPAILRAGNLSWARLGRDQGGLSSHKQCNHFGEGGFLWDP